MPSSIIGARPHEARAIPIDRCCRVGALMDRYQIRVLQESLQVSAIRSRRDVPLNTIATMVGRDPVTGDRLLKSPDGGDMRQRWISNSDPDEIPPVAIPSNTIGLPGFSSQKPK